MELQVQAWVPKEGYSEHKQDAQEISGEWEGQTGSCTFSLLSYSTDTYQAKQACLSQG
jgi:hypothetical protein